MVLSGPVHNVLEAASQKKQTSSKMVTSAKVPVPNPTVHSFEDAKIQRGERRSGQKSGGDVDISGEEQHSQEEPSVSTGKELTDIKNW